MPQSRPSYSARVRGLRNYYHIYRDSNATSADFERVMAKTSGTDLGWFFQQWLHQPRYPQLDVSWQYDAGARRALIGITQRQKSAWGLFRLPIVTLEFRNAAGAAVRRDIAVTRRQTDLRVDVPFAPAEIRVDPEGRLLLQTTAVVRR